MGNMKPLVPTVECSALISTTPECSRLGFVKANTLEWHLNLSLEWKSQEELNLLVYRFGYKARFQNGTHWKSLGVLYPNQGRYQDCARWCEQEKEYEEEAQTGKYGCECFL